MSHQLKLTPLHDRLESTVFPVALAHAVEFRSVRCLPHAYQPSHAAFQTRRSTEEREAPRSPSLARLRRSDPQLPHQHRWRSFLRDAASTFSRRQRPSP